MARFPEIDRYAFDDVIGSGGFSTVYRAKHEYTTETVAIKVISPQLGQQALDVFEREAQILVELRREPNIVRVLDAGKTPDGSFYIVMDYYETSFDKVGDVPVEKVLDVGQKVARALAVMHEQGIIHKDVKPANIFADENLEPALGDFGIATNENIDRSRTIQAFSFNYAAPEIFAGGRAEAPRDVYALGATLYHFLEGEPPLARQSSGGEMPELLVLRIADQAPDPFENPDVEPDLADVILRSLAKDPTERPTAGELAERLGAVARRREDPGPAGAVPPPPAPLDPAPLAPMEVAPPLDVAPPDRPLPAPLDPAPVAPIEVAPPAGPLPAPAVPSPPAPAAPPSPAAAVSSSPAPADLRPPPLDGPGPPPPSDPLPPADIDPPPDGGRTSLRGYRGIAGPEPGPANGPATGSAPAASPREDESAVPSSEPDGAGPSLPDRVRRFRGVAAVAAIVVLFLGFGTWRLVTGPGESEPAGPPLTSGTTATAASTGDGSGTAAPTTGSITALLAPEDVSVEANGDGSYTISWSARSAAPSGFQVSLVGADNVFETAASSPHRWTTELPSGTAACFVVAAAGDGGISFASPIGCS